MAVVTALILLVLLIIFILQNQEPARVIFLGLEGTLPLGMALFIASVATGPRLKARQASGRRPVALGPR